MKVGKDLKYYTLEENNTLNPHSEMVCETLFQKHNFFDPRDLLQVKYEMLRSMQQRQGTVFKISKRFGFSRPSLYKALADFEKEGLWGLVPRKRGPKTAHKLSNEVMAFIEKMLESTQPPTIKTILKKVEERFNLVLHPRSIQRALNRRKKN
jgi:transposase